MKAIQDYRVTLARGRRDTDNEGGRPIPREWFNENPEPIADYEMNALAHKTLRDIDGNELPDLQNGWIDVEFDLDEIERLRGENSAWPLNKRGDLAVTDETKPVAPESPEDESTKRGRKPIWDWEGAFAHLLWVANCPDGLPRVQADIERLVADWFRQTVDNEPAESAIRKRVSVWCKEVLGKA